ncbi:MAG TPA: hypothetical protein VM103_01540 [Candidatus Paceibacterota bacterium]|nr:hypothetical protein [Candidatus Paceibacterota bacterium]
MSRMTSELTRHLGLAHKLFQAGDVAGFTPELWNTLAERPLLFKEVRAVIEGNATVTITRHVVGCNASEPQLRGYTIASHSRLRRDWEFRKYEMKLWQPDEKLHQQCLRAAFREIDQKYLLNASILEYLLAHPEVMPEDTENKIKKDGPILFLGTVYENTEGDQLVRALTSYWDGLGENMIYLQNPVGGPWQVALRPW